MKTAEIILVGRVQGVMFRDWLAEKATQQRLHGIVQNKKDGSVHVILQGEQNAINGLIGLMFEGSPLSKVESLNIKWVETGKKYGNFKIIKRKNFFIDQAHSMTNLVKELSQNALNNLQPNTKPAIPIHAAIIPDGNRRWARSKGWHAWVGHRIGMSNERFSELFDVCDNVGIKYLSFWGFSTENWDRSKQEIEFLWNIYRSSISKWTENLQKRNMRFIHAGRKDHLPEDIITNLAKLEETTKNNNGLTFLFCLDYGGRDEIARAVNKALKNNVKVFDIEKIRSYLDTGNIPDPDLIIRTGGEKRLSGFMAYQCAYSELYFTNTFFPDFAGKEFSLALADYSKRIRRFGGDSAKDLLNIDTSKLFDPKYDHLQS